MSRQRIGVFGAGAFGTALAVLYAEDFDVSLFSFFEEHVCAMKKKRENEFLPGVVLSEKITIGNLQSLQDFDFDYVFWAFPIKPTAEMLFSIKDMLKSPVILCSKGLLDDGAFLFDLFEKETQNCLIGYLSGPNFAIDLAAGRFSCANIGAMCLHDAELLAKALTNKNFRLYPTADIVGMQICGAVKNVVAIACGIADGLNLGQNVHAALLAFGIFEMKNLGVALGALEETFYGFCGVGDLLLTASSETSRNMNFGKKLAKNVLENVGETCEGFYAVEHVLKLAKKNNVLMPICQSVCDIIFNKAAPQSILNVFN